MEIPYTVYTPPLRLSLFKGEGRVREHRVIVWPEPLTSILSPSARGEADGFAMPVF
jgi:hypothetical protein